MEKIDGVLTMTGAMLEKHAMLANTFDIKSVKVIMSTIDDKCWEILMYVMVVDLKNKFLQ